ncbi:hypothetical protein AOLI_G00297060 [Acnodon oligacanthus]
MVAVTPSPERPFGGGRQQAPLCFAGVARLRLPAADWPAARPRDVNAAPRLAEGASVVLRLAETAVNHTRRGGGNRRLTEEKLRLACCLNVQAAAASSSARLRLPDQPAVARSSGCSFPSSAPPFSFGGFTLMLLGATSRKGKEGDFLLVSSTRWGLQDRRSSGDFDTARDATFHRDIFFSSPPKQPPRFRSAVHHPPSQPAGQPASLPRSVRGRSPALHNPPSGIYGGDLVHSQPCKRASLAS